MVVLDIWGLSVKAGKPHKTDENWTSFLRGLHSCSGAESMLLCGGAPPTTVTSIQGLKKPGEDSRRQRYSSISFVF